MDGRKLAPCRRAHSGLPRIGTGSAKRAQRIGTTTLRERRSGIARRNSDREDEVAIRMAYWKGKQGVTA